MTPTKDQMAAIESMVITYLNNIKPDLSDREGLRAYFYAMIAGGHAFDLIMFTPSELVSIAVDIDL